MLSEHETLELLEQLKQEVLPGTSGFSELQVDAVGHWPVLVGGGMCLNLQAVAALELNTQPEYIYVTPTRAKTISCISLASCYQEVHHLSTGIDGRSLVIAYDQQFSSMLSLLQKTDYHSTKEYFTVPDAGLPDTRSDEVSRQYEFSQAMATSIDPGPSGDHQPVGLSFLTLDAKEHTVAGSWHLQLRHRELVSEFFVGLVNTQYDDNSISLQPQPVETFSIVVRAEKISRTNGLNAMVAELAQPDLITIEKTVDRGSFPMAHEIGSMDSSREQEISVSNLLVHRMLQLSVDDLYMLLVEAIGTGIELTFRLEVEPFSVDTPGQLLREGCSHRCLSVNGLPVRQGYLSVSDRKLLFNSHE